MVNAQNNRSLNAPETSGYGQSNEPIPVVLIVDDDDDSRLMLKIILEIWKYQVIEATDGIEALNIAENSCPDLILMDVRMPRLDGFGVTCQIRQSTKIESVPIIFLSGCAEASYKQEASAVGGNEYLVKPLDFEELEITLGKYIRPSQEISIL
ncbi:MAG: response regulator [Pyrinomonadaceae bacterium]